MSRFLLGARRTEARNGAFLRQLPASLEWDSGFCHHDREAPNLAGGRTDIEKKMQRTTAIAVGLLFVLGIVLVLVMGRSSPQAATASHPAPSASVAPSAAPVASALGVASSTPPASSAEAVELDEVKQSEGFDTLPDGRRVPDLPASAPKEVRFGVIQVSYQGAQGAPKDARSKDDAKARAMTLAAEAKQDFAAAVAKGDRGSTSDAGRVPRDVLEPVVEYVLFTLPRGEVHPEPIDTPRGYWIVRRNR